MPFVRHPALWFTRSEAERILQRTQADVTSWQLYALPLGRQVPDGSAVLYDVEDLALARLAARMRVYLSPVVVRYVIGQLREPLREALRARGPRVLVLRGGGRFRRAPQGQIVPAKDAPTDVLTFLLHDLLDARLERAAAAERRATPEVWIGHRRVSAEVVSSSLATPVVSVA
jgi:hypothetical protein